MTFPKSYFLILPLLFLFSECSTEEEFPIKKEYPVVETLDPIHIDETGVTLRARVISSGSVEIVDFGFIWQGNGNTFQKSLADQQFKNSLEYRISNDQIKDTGYVYRAFLRTEDLMILGNEKSFRSIKGNGQE